MNHFKLGRVVALFSASLLVAASAHAARAEARISNVQIQVIDLTPNDGKAASVQLLNGYGGQTSVRSSLTSWLSVGADDYLLSTNEGPAATVLNVTDRDSQGSFMSHLGQFLTVLQAQGGNVLTTGWAGRAASETSTLTFRSGGSSQIYGDFQLSGQAKLVITASVEVLDLQVNAAQAATIWGGVSLSTGDLQTRILTQQDEMHVSALSGQTPVPTTFQLSASFSNATAADVYGVFQAQLVVNANGGPVAAVPEPASALLLMAGMGVLGAAARRLRSRQRV